MVGKTVKIRIVIIFSVLLCMSALLCIPASAAQNPTFRLDMDSLNLQKGVSINMVVSLVDAQDAQIISIDGIENFDILSQSQSSYTSITNNVTTYQLDIYYTIMPKTVGQFTLKANIQYNGQSYETNSLEVTVTETSDNQNGAVSDLFVKTICSHTEAYLGEKIVVSYELYARENIDSLGFIDYISIDGVIVKEMPDSPIKTEVVYIDGNKYIKYEVNKLIIDPIKTGTCTIPSFNLQANVISGNGFGGAFGGLLRSSVPKYLQTEKLEILVKPLPSEGKPANFSGIVGELNLTGSYSRSEVNYGDSLALQAEASGNCNLDGLKSIVGGIPGFTVYETQKNAGESVENNQYNAQKAFEVILVPEKNGELDIPPVSVSYFNPNIDRYETAEIPVAKINVLGDMPLSSLNTGGNNHNQTGSRETVLINQVSYADISDGYFTLQMPKELLYTILIGLAVALVLVFGLLRFVSVRKKQTPELKSLYRQLTDSKDINEIYNLFNAMIKHRYNLNLKASSKNAVRSILHDDDVASQVTDIMDYMESVEVYAEKGHIYLKDKIKGFYTAKLRV